MLRDLIVRNRSCRRFVEKERISVETLRDLVDLARLSASGANLQPLKYVLSAEPDRNQRIFPSLMWASYLADWSGPPEGERPAAYIVVLADSRVSKSAGCDHGIAAQSILLGAREKGLAGCMVGSIRRNQLRQVLHIPEWAEILLVIALGKPAEEVVVDEIAPGASIKYYRDESGVHHVPKRALDEVILDVSQGHK